MLAGAAPGKSRCPPTPIPVLCHGTGKVTATSIPQAMAHRELEMSHQCVVLAPSAAVMPQQVPPLPGACPPAPTSRGHEHYCVCIGTIEDSSCLSSKPSPSPREEHEKSSLGTGTLRDTEGFTATSRPSSPAPADCSHNQSRDPSQCAHHDQPCRGKPS